MIGRISYRSL